MNKLGMAILLTLQVAPVGSAVAVSAVSNALVLVTPAGEGVFGFSQDGFGLGGMVSGVFAGHDLDHNGQISSLRGEVSDFALSFGGNGLVQPFELRRQDLTVLVYDLDGTIGDGLHGDIEGLSAFRTGGIFYLAGANAFRPCGDGTTCALLDDGQQQILATPGAALLLSAGMLAFSLCRRSCRA